MHHSFSRESFKVFEHVLTQGFEPRMSISKSVLHIHWLPMFLHLFNTVFEKLHKQIKLPNLCPKPPKLPPVILAFCHSFFYSGFKKQKKNKIAHPKGGNSGRELGLFFFCFLVLFSHCRRNQERTKKQETKKPRNQKNKKKNKKTRLHTPRGVVVVESWVLSFCFFCFFLSFGFLVSWFFGVLFFCVFLFLVLFSHCRKTKQKLSMVAKQ